MTEDARKRVAEEPCRCVRCSFCNGSGTMRVETNTWPEYDLESCDICCGSGIVETCGRCELLEDMDADG